VDSIVAPGVIVSGGTCARLGALSRGARGRGAIVEGSVLLDGVEVGRVRWSAGDHRQGGGGPPGTVIGQDPKIEARRFTVSDRGIVVIPKRQVIEPVA